MPVVIRALRRDAGSPDLRWNPWTQLRAADGTSPDAFGYSIAVSGTIAVIGAPYKNNYTGAAYIFVRSGTTWSQQAELTAPDGGAQDQFGYAVAVYGSTVVIGAPNKSNNTGAAYVFVRSGTTWSQQAEFTATAGKPNDNFGTSVALDGDTAMVGSPMSNGGNGAAYAFVRTGTAWSLQTKLAPSMGATEQDFGSAVALTGNIAVVGADFQAGVADVFIRS